MIRSLRLRTLPLSLSGVCLGLLLAAADYRISLSTAAFTMLTTISLQILSNLSNELGDVLSGTDNRQRQGPAYGLNGGELSIGTMKMMIAVAVVACIAGGLVMLRSSFGTLFCMDSICLMLLGGAAIMAAMKYTLGRDPYGYRGLGDASVFLFFGIVAVLGSYFVATHTIGSWFLLLPAAALRRFLPPASPRRASLRSRRPGAAARLRRAALRAPRPFSSIPKRRTLPGAPPKYPFFRRLIPARCAAVPPPARRPSRR